MILFISLFTLISCQQEREISYAQMRDVLHITKCNLHRYEETQLGDVCYCRDLLGYGPTCQIEKLFNRTHFQIFFLCLQDESDSWMKNLEIQFQNVMIKIVEKTKYYVKGFVKDLFYFKVEYLCPLHYKIVIPWPRLKGKIIEEIFSKKINVKTDSTKGEIKTNYESVDEDVTICNSGRFLKRRFTCDCRYVLGDGLRCEIEKSFNRTHIQVISLDLPDDSDYGHYMEKNKNMSKGFVEDFIYFKVEYFKSTHHKIIFPWPRLEGKMLHWITSKKIDITTHSTKEEMKNTYESYKRNETKLDKNYPIYFYCIWALAVILIVVLFYVIKLHWKDINKLFCRPTINRARSKELMNLGENPVSLEDLSGTQKIVVTGTCGEVSLDVQESAL